MNHTAKFFIPRPGKHAAGLLMGVTLFTLGCSVAGEGSIVEVTQSPAAEPTLIPATVKPDISLTTYGGFVDNAVDVTTLPEYAVEPKGWGVEGGPAACPDVKPSETVALVDTWRFVKQLCLYGLPNPVDGAQFSVTLISPSESSYRSEFDLHYVNNNFDSLRVVQNTPSSDTQGDVTWDASSRVVISYPVYFHPGQEYGLWRVEAATGGQPFASGTVTVTASGPVYSLSSSEDPLDPFVPPDLQATFSAGDRVSFAARGLEPGRKLVLALYTSDPERSTDTMVVEIPVYATQVTVDEEGAFQAEFVVGSETRATTYMAHVDPQPGQYDPYQLSLGLTIEQP